MPEDFEDRTSRPEFQNAVYGEQDKGKDSEMVKEEEPKPELTLNGPDGQAVDNAQHRRRMSAEPAQQELADRRLDEFNAERAARERENEARSETFAREAKDSPLQNQEKQRQEGHDQDIEHRSSPYVRKEAERLNAQRAQEELAAKRLAEFRQNGRSYTQERQVSPPAQTRSEDFNRSAQGRDQSDDDMSW